jgi:hypothetical protein
MEKRGREKKKMLFIEKGKVSVLRNRFGTSCSTEQVVSKSQMKYRYRYKICKKKYYYDAELYVLIILTLLNF